MSGHFGVNGDAPFDLDKGAEEWEKLRRPEKPVAELTFAVTVEGNEGKIELKAEAPDTNELTA